MGRLWLRIAVTVAAIAGGVLLSPMALRHGLVAALAQDGVRTVAIGRVAGNPFTGAFSLSDVRVAGADGKGARIERLAVDIALRDLVRRRFHLSTVVLAGAEIDVESRRDGTLAIASLPTSGDQSVPLSWAFGRWAFGLGALTVERTTIVYHQPDRRRELHIERMSFDSLADWMPNSPARFDGSTRFETGVVRFSGTAMPYAGEPHFEARLDLAAHALAPWSSLLGIAPLTLTDGMLSAELTVAAALSRSNEATVRLQGRIGLDGLAAEFQTDGMSSVAFGKASISELDATLRLTGGTVTGLTIRADAALADIAIDAPGFGLRTGPAGWQGTTEVMLPPSGGYRVQADGRLNAETLALHLPEAGLAISQASAGWTGRVQLHKADAAAVPRIEAEGRAEAGGVAIESPGSGLRLLALDSVAADGLRLIDWSRLTADRIAFDGADIAITRLADGKVRLPDALRQPAGPAAAERSRPFSFAVGEWVAGGGSRLGFEDHSVSPPARLALAPFALRIDHLDSAEPARNLPMELSGKLGKYATFRLTGTFRPFAPRLNLDLEAKILGFDLTAITGYARRHLGYDLTRGRLDAGGSAAVVDGRLNARTTLALSRLEAIPIDRNRPGRLNEQVEIPVDRALALLRDSEDVIRMTVPVTGELDNPRFDFSDTINRAIGNALKETVLATVKLAFPLGGIFMAMVEAGGATSLRFDPVSFAPGGVGLDAKARAHLDEVGKLLRERPGVTLTISAWATESDRRALADGARIRPDGITRERLLDLATSRAWQVKDLLLATHGIAEDRLYLTAPRFADQPDAPPRAEIFL